MLNLSKVPLGSGDSRILTLEGEGGHGDAFADLEGDRRERERFLSKDKITSWEMIDDWVPGED